MFFESESLANGTSPLEKKQNDLFGKNDGPTIGSTTTMLSIAYTQYIHIKRFAYSI
jgi:hypothetical protein